MPDPVLVVRAGALGDTLMVTPLLRRLHAEDPRREIDVLCSAGGASLLRTNPAGGWPQSPLRRGLQPVVPVSTVNWPIVCLL